VVTVRSVGSPEVVTDFRDQIRNPADAIHELIRSKLLDVHVALPAIITEAFDSARCSVTVKPLLKRPLRAPDGSFTSEELPELYDVPVCFPMFNGFQMTFPIAVGDVVMLVFCDYDVAAWSLVGDVTGPGDVRRHHLTGAVALPCGLRKLSQPMTAFNSTALEFGSASGIRISVTGSQMRVGGDADSAALASKVDALASALNTFIGVYNSHTHGGVTTGAGTSGTSATPGSTYGGGASASAVLKVSS
jgi:hypothetical protein